MNPGETAIRAEQLVKRFGEFPAVNGVSFTVHSGEIFGFLGPNGSGKTTTIRMLLGLLQPSSGTVEVLGVQVTRQPAAIRPRVGYMSQQFSLYRDLTVEQNLRFYGTAYGLEGDKLKGRMSEAVELAGLRGLEGMLTRELSGGWRQRLALGAALLHSPAVLFLDEPTAGVDPVSRRAFWELLYGLVERGVTVFVTTHYMDEAEHCHRLAFLQRGEIIAMGSPEEIKSDMMRGAVYEMAASDSAHAYEILRQPGLRHRLGIQSVELYGSLLHVWLGDQREAVDAIRAELGALGLEISDLRRIEPTLEDVFIACMRRDHSPQLDG